MTRPQIEPADIGSTECAGRRCSGSAAKPIPRSILAPLAATAWAHDDYSLHKFGNLLAHHAAADRADGATCCYVVSDAPGDCCSLTGAEFRAMVREGAIPPDMHGANALNQHWLHSLEQFYAEATVAWQQHCQRAAELTGRPAGRLAK